MLLFQDLEDSGWWKGELRGLVGVFPDNFVELLPDEAPVSELTHRYEYTYSPIVIVTIVHSV